MSSHDLLTKVAKMITEFANDEGISLADEFGTKSAFNEFVIALTFKQLKEIGLETNAAYDLIFGEGKYAELVESVWNNCQ